MYTDNDIFPNAEVFDAFRFSRLRDIKGQENRHQFVTTSTTHINFGHGKHTCPGRFFASHEIKLLLAYTLLNYDVRLAGLKPKATWYDRSRRPDQKAEVQFRKRSTGSWIDFHQLGVLHAVWGRGKKNELGYGWNEKRSALGIVQVASGLA